MDYCEELRRQETSLDKVELDITSSPRLPRHAKIIMDFNQRKNTVTMRVTSPLDSTLYKDIHLPHWARDLLPLSYARSGLEQSYRALYGSTLHSQCVIGQDHVKTFDRKTYSYQMDDCNHLVASDCSPKKTHAVLAKEKDNVKHITIYYQDTKIVLKEPASRYQAPASNYRV